YRLFNEGLCGRTTAYDIPQEPCRNGLEYLPVALSTVAPIDLIVIMLGTNDRRLRVSPQESAISLERYIHYIRTPALWFSEQTPEILIVSPAPIGRQALDTYYKFYWNEAAIADSEELGTHYQALADTYGCEFLDCKGICTPGSDGVHLDKEGHTALARAMARKIREIFSEPASDAEVQEKQKI
ncbi:MAG: GDSL-type esterase/lipase family protein, partial [Butyricicoccus sp.]